MRIECPGCGARYEVPDDRLAPGRSVRCARCGRDWIALGTEARVVPAAPRLPAEPDPPSVEESATLPPRPFMLASQASDPPVVVPMQHAPPRRSAALVAAWAASGGLVAAALVLAVVLREPIARAWPPSLRVYDALNLSVTESR